MIVSLSRRGEIEVSNSSKRVTSHAGRAMCWFRSCFASNCSEATGRGTISAQAKIAANGIYAASEKLAVNNMGNVVPSE